MEQPNMREQHLQADADSLRADCERLANVIAAERNRAQVVLSQKGILEVVNAHLLAALEEALAHADRWHGEGQSGEGRRCTACIEFQPAARAAIEEAKK